MNSKLKISKKFVGRDDEVEKLESIYRNLRDQHKADLLTHHAEMTGGPPPKQRNSGGVAARRRAPSAYVSGLSGTGKSSLVRRALEAIVESDKNHFCLGKFDAQINGKPFSAIVDALDNLCAKVIHEAQQNNTTQQLKEMIGDAIGDHEAVATSLLPNLSKVLNARRESVASISTAASSTTKKNYHSSRKHTFFRLKDIIRKLVQVLVGDKILVLFIDDLQVRLYCILLSSQFASTVYQY